MFGGDAGGVAGGPLFFLARCDSLAPFLPFLPFLQIFDFDDDAPSLFASADEFDSLDAALAASGATTADDLAASSVAPRRAPAAPPPSAADGASDGGRSSSTGCDATGPAAAVSRHAASFAAAAAALAARATDADAAPLSRIERVARYRAKRARRSFRKTIRYESRRAYAEVRPRIKGRFATRDEVAAMRSGASLSL